MAKKPKKASNAKREQRKPRPNVKNLRKDMKSMRDDLETIIDAKEDEQGQLSEDQLEKAKKTRDGLNAALASIECIQTQAPY